MRFKLWLVLVCVLAVGGIAEPESDDPPAGLVVEPDPAPAPGSALRSSTGAAFCDSGVEEQAASRALRTAA